MRGFADNVMSVMVTFEQANVPFFTLIKELSSNGAIPDSGLILVSLKLNLPDDVTENTGADVSPSFKISVM